MNCDIPMKKESGEKMVKDAREWCEAHPDVWRKIENMARSVVRRGGRCSTRVLIDNVCWREHVGIKHSLTAPLARILTERVPGYESCARTARSKVDAL